MKKLILLTALCGCATVPMARKDLDERAKDLNPPADAANLYVYRTSSVLGMAVKVRVFFDEVPIGDLGPGTFAVLTVRPGEHKLVARANGSADQTLVVEPGRNYYVKTAPAWTGASIEVITDERSAQEDIRGCGLIASVAAEAIRHVAAEIAKVNVDPVEPDALIGEATRALEAMGARPEPSQTSDLDTTVARLHASHPGLDDRQMIHVGARAMIASLRPKPAQAALSTPRAIDGSCGLILRREGHEVVIAGALPDSPAAVARVEAGLELREVNGQPARDHAPGEIAQLLAGTPGSEVALTVGRPGEADRKLVLRRAPTDAPAVDCRVVNGRVLYLRPWGLWSATARRVRDHGRSAGVPARLVILDLRDSSGGSVDGARDIADSFLPAGIIVSVVGARVPNVNKTYSATPGTSESALKQARLVVLVNGNTSGSAEAVAAAVQDNRRGRVLGSKTAGAGMVDYVYGLVGMRLSIPTARLLRAGGEPLDGRGVTPDVLDDALAPAPRAAMSDAACPNVASPAAVSDDQLVRRAAGLLLASTDA